MTYERDLLIKNLASLGIELSENQAEQFDTYYRLLTERNKVMDLTAITDYEAVVKKHFTDSLTLCKAVELKGDLSLIDVGSGAGFPGIPLKIVYPDLQITLLDSLSKRVNFLDEVINVLELKKIRAIHGRAEELGRMGEHREQYDLCVSRAVAKLSVLAEYCLPFVKVGGNFIAYKSGEVQDELINAENALTVLGGGKAKEFYFQLPESDIDRCLVTIFKAGETPVKYPRKAGIVEKKPL